MALQLEAKFMTDRMRIAEQYFQHLLFNTGAFEAVNEISGMWEPRVNAQASRLGLSQP